MSKLLIWAVLAAGCTTVQPSSPEPMKPEDVEEEQPEDSNLPPAETPDETFVREFDACWRTYKECLKTASDEVCFPPHEVCAVTAYRKLKKARGA